MITFKEKDYKNFGKCLEISNGIVDLLVTLDIGPRIIRYGFCGKENMMYEDIDRITHNKSEEVKDVYGDDAVWYLYGGHRLWISPEYAETYYPDNNPVSYEIHENEVFFSTEIQDVTGLQFTTTVLLSEESSDVKVTHFIENCSGESQKFAMWALTVLDRGGVELLPFNTEDTGLLPNRTFMVWPYTNLADHRVHFGDKFMTLKSDNTERAFKLGMDLRKGTVAYVNKGHMFVKRFVHYDNSEYPDNGCSFETYTCATFLECETLAEYGPKPDGSMVSHTEYWSLFDKVEVKDPKDEKEVAGIFEKYDLL